MCWRWLASFQRVSLSFCVYRAGEEQQQQQQQSALAPSLSLLCFWLANGPGVRPCWLWVQGEHLVDSVGLGGRKQYLKWREKKKERWRVSCVNMRYLLTVFRQAVVPALALCPPPVLFTIDIEWKSNIMKLMTAQSQSTWMESFDWFQLAKHKVGGHNTKDWLDYCPALVKKPNCFISRLGELCWKSFFFFILIIFFKALHKPLENKKWQIKKKKKRKKPILIESIKREGTAGKIGSYFSVEAWAPTLLDWLDGAIKAAKGPEYQYIRSVAVLNKSRLRRRFRSCPLGGNDKRTLGRLLCRFQLAGLILWSSWRLSCCCCCCQCLLAKEIQFKNIKTSAGTLALTVREGDNLLWAVSRKTSMLLYRYCAEPTVIKMTTPRRQRHH